jgi:hypothetical protein
MIDFKPARSSSQGQGWIDALETWTYASSTTFTIAGDLTGKYQKGDKIKLINSTTKYFYVVSVTYSNPNTTITVTGGSDYSLANAAISANYYSKIENPQGFPDWFNYTPTVTGSTGTIGTFAASPYAGRFKVQGSECRINVKIKITNKGSWSGNVRVATPITIASTINNEGMLPGYVAAQGGNAATASRAVVATPTSVAYCSFLDGIDSSALDWTVIATNDHIRINGSFEI